MSKTIVHVISTLNPNGAERLVVDLVCALKARDITCTIVTLFTVPHSMLADKLESEGIRHICIGGKNWRDFSIILKLRKVLITLKPDIIHSHLFPPEYFVPIAAPKNIPLLHTEHSVSNKRRSLPIARLLESFIYRRFRTIICISHGVKKSLDAWTPSISNRTIVINNGVHLELFKTRSGYDMKAKFGITATCTLISMIGRFEMPPKDQATIIRALALLPDVHCILAGNGPDLEILKKMAEEYRISDRIHFPGYVNNVNELLSSTDIYIYSSYHEGFGLAVIEAMAAGVPVVASNVNALNTLVVDSLNGLLFTRGSEQELSVSITKLRSDSLLRIKCINNGFETAEQYSFDKMVHGYVDLYKEILR